MKKIYITIFSLVVLYISTFSFVFYTNNTVKNNKGFEKFLNEIKAKNYSFQVEDTEKDFLLGHRKRITFADNEINVYLYHDNSDMEEDAKRIHRGGSSYSSFWKTSFVSWAGTPHFFKEDDIIVLYVGEDKAILNDLKSILGEQFAGGK